MRANEVETGDTLPDGRKVVRVSRTEQCIYIYVESDTSRPKRLRYQPDTILPLPGERHPSRYQNGHPWTRYRASTTGWTSLPGN